MEWTRIEKRVHQTLNVTILKIEMVQNKKIYQHYRSNKSFIESENGGEANELELFHGTSNTSPSIIYNGSKGFDHQHGSSGMWGVATYFAQNGNFKFFFFSLIFFFFAASYSNTYSHSDFSSKQFFLATVLGNHKIFFQNT